MANDEEYRAAQAEADAAVERAKALRPKRRVTGKGILIGSFLGIGMLGIVSSALTPEVTPAAPTAERTIAAPAVAAARVEETPTASAAPALYLEKGWGCSREYSYSTFEGQVTNNTDKTISNLQAVVTYKKTDGTFVTSDTSYVEYTTLLAGQTTPFKVMTRDNPAMEQCSVAFTVRGTQLRTERRE